MTGLEIIEKVKALQLPEGEYLVFGACPLAVAGLRETGDIDMLVSTGVLKDLEKRGWVQIYKDEDDKPFTHDIFEAHDSWNFDGYTRTLDELLKTADIVDGIPFASLQDVRAWKLASARPKDLRDIELIDTYLAKH
jgi:hypothetical protein